eukprot:1912946-Ditylum_brightwellii.AAC.1
MWKIRLSILKHRGQIAHRRNRREGNSSPLPADAQSAKCVGTKATLFSTGWTEQVPAVQKTHKSMNLQEMCINGLKSRTWATKSMRTSDNG